MEDYIVLLVRHFKHSGTLTCMQYYNLAYHHIKFSQVTSYDS